MRNENKKCPDCNSDLKLIQLLDATQPGLSRQRTVQVPFSYADANVAPSGFLSHVKQAESLWGLYAPSVIGYFCTTGLLNNARLPTGISDHREDRLNSRA